MGNNITLFSKEDAEAIGPQFYRLRRERNLSLEELKAHIHLSVRRLSRIEKGEYLPIIPALRLAKFYGQKVRITLE